MALADLHCTITWLGTHQVRLVWDWSNANQLLDFTPTTGVTLVRGTGTLTIQGGSGDVWGMRLNEPLALSHISVPATCSASTHLPVFLCNVANTFTGSAWTPNPGIGLAWYDADLFYCLNGASGSFASPGNPGANSTHTYQLDLSTSSLSGTTNLDGVAHARSDTYAPSTSGYVAIGGFQGGPTFGTLTIEGTTTETQPGGSTTYTADLSESESEDESLAAVRSGVIGINETTSITEATSTLRFVANVGLNETQTASESETERFTARPGLTETDSIAESPTTTFSAITRVNESETESESINSTGTTTYTATLSETETESESAAIVQTAPIDLSENETKGETLLASLLLASTVSESLAESESTSLVFSPIIELSELETKSEVLTSQFNAITGVNESETESESATATATNGSSVTIGGSDPVLYWFGVQTPGTFNGHPYVDLVGSQACVRTAFTGNRLDICIGDGAWSVTIDGVTTTGTVPGGTGLGWVTVATGLTDTLHTVSFYSRYIQTDTIARTFGSAPAFSAPTGYGTLVPLHSATYATFGRLDGGPYSGADVVGVNSDAYAWVGHRILRFRCSATDLYLWMATDRALGIAVISDGSQISSFTSSNSGAFDLVHIATGLDVAEHTYEVVVYSPTSGYHVYASYLMMSGGTGASSTRPDALKTVISFGDSQVGSLGGDDVTDLRYGDQWRTAHELGADSVIWSFPGMLMDTALSQVDRTTRPPNADLVVLEWGGGDLFNGTTVGDVNTPGTFAYNYLAQIRAVAANLPATSTILVRGILPAHYNNYQNRDLYTAAQVAAVNAYMAGTHTVTAVYFNTDTFISNTPGEDLASDGDHINMAGLAKLSNREGPIVAGYLLGQSFSISGPSGGQYTLSLPSTWTFSGYETIAISDGNQGGTITPSIGSSGVNSVNVTPTAGLHSFTFSYTPNGSGTRTITFTSNQPSWVSPAALTVGAPLIEISLSETTDLSEQNTIGMLSRPSLIESVGSSESINLIVAFGITIGEALGLTEEQTLSLIRIIGISESVSSTEGIVSAVSYITSVIEALGLTEAQSIAMSQILSIAEGVALTESGTGGLAFVSNLIELITSNEELSVIYGGRPAIIEAISALDSLFVTGGQVLESRHTLFPTITENRPVVTISCTAPSVIIQIIEPFLPVTITEIEP